MCNKIILKDNILVELANFWSAELGEYIDPETMMRLFLKVTNVSKYRSFQYRPLQNSIVLNKYLKRYKIVCDDCCKFCKQRMETIMHILWHCEWVQDFWRQVQNIIAEICPEYNFDLSWTIRSIMFNMVHKRNNNVINFIVVVAK